MHQILKCHFKENLEVLSDWLVDTKLSLHLDKTESILFGSRQRLRSRSDLHIECKGTAVEPKDYVIYFGVGLHGSV